MFSKIIPRSARVESSSFFPHKDRRHSSQLDQPISMTPDIDTPLTAPVEGDNAYEPVTFNADHGMCSGKASKKPETSGAAVTNDDKVLLCNNCVI